MTNQHAVVTGAGGFIGRHLVDRLMRDGAEITVLVRPSSRLPNVWHGKVERIDCQEWALPGIRSALDRCSFDILYHLAAYGVNPADRDLESMLRINIEVPTALLRVCKLHDAGMVMAGSSAEYREPMAQEPLNELSPIETGKLYGTSKAVGGLLASAVASELGVQLRLLRLFNVYGIGEAPTRLLPSLVRGLRAGKTVPLSAGTQIRDFIAVDDIVDAFAKTRDELRSASAGSSAIWNVCTGTGHSVREFATTVADLMDVDRNLLCFGQIEMRKDEVPWLVGCRARITADLGWRPQHDLASGLRQTISSLAQKACLA